MVSDFTRMMVIGLLCFQELGISYLYLHDALLSSVLMRLDDDVILDDYWIIVGREHESIIFLLVLRRFCRLSR